MKESTNSLNANGGQNGIGVSSFQRDDVKFLMTRLTVVCFFVMHDMGPVSIIVHEGGELQYYARIGYGFST